MYKYLILFLFLFSCNSVQETINPKCENGLIFQFKSDLPLSTKLYDCELIEEGTEKVIQSFKSMINDNQFIKINDLDKGLKLKLKVKDNISNKVITSNVVESCSDTREVVEIKGFSIPVNEIKGEVKITLLFPCAEIDTKKLPALELYSRCKIAGTNQWFDLPILKYSTDGKNYFSITTNLLKVGTSYDFQVGAAPGYYAFTENGVTIDNEDWVIIIGTELFCK